MRLGSHTRRRRNFSPSPEASMEEAMRVLRRLKSSGYNLYKRLFKDRTEAAIFFIAFLVEIAFGVYLIQRWGHTFPEGDAVAHLYISRMVVDNGGGINFGNLGTFWLPVFHLLVMPLIGINTLYKTGLAGTIVNAFASGGICVVLCRLTGKNRILASILFMFNGFTLIYGATPMIEQTSIFFMVLATYYFKIYWEKNDLLAFMKCSLALLFGTLIRYEVWAVSLMITTFFFIKELRRRRFHRLAYIHFPFWGIFAWFFWNLAIFRDPLMFLHHPFQGSLGQIPIPAGGSIWLTLVDVIKNLFTICGGLFAVSFASIILLLIYKRYSEILSLMPLVAPILFQGVFIFQRMSAGCLRYFYLGLPGIIIISLAPIVHVSGSRGSLTRIRTLKIIVIIAIFSMSLLNHQAHFDLLATGKIEEATNWGDSTFILNFSLMTREMEKIKVVMQIINGSNYLVYKGSKFSVFTGVSPAVLIDEYDNPIYVKVMEEPWKYCAFVIMPKAITNLQSLNDYYDGKFYVYLFNNNAIWRERFLSHFRLVLETDSVFIYQNEGGQ